MMCVLLVTEEETPWTNILSQETGTAEWIRVSDGNKYKFTSLDLIEDDLFIPYCLINTEVPP